MDINEKHKRIFNYILLGTLIIFMTLLLFGLKDFSRDGVTCQAQPFLYGARKVASERGNEHMYCSCSIYGKQGSKHYSFSEVGENPDYYITDYNNLSIEYNKTN